MNQPTLLPTRLQILSVIGASLLILSVPMLRPAPAESEPETAAAATATDDTASPSEILAAYLRRSPADPKERAAALDLVNEAQVVFLRYERETPRDSPGETAEFTSSLKASSVTGIDHHKDGKRYPQIKAVFSKFFGDPEFMKRDEWLRQMKRPIDAGYELKSVLVVSPPPRNVKRESLTRAQKAARALARELEGMKAEFSQLQEFQAAQNLHIGGWNDEDWPDYPGLSYEHAVGPETKGGHETYYADDWCDIRFGVYQIKGYPHARITPTRQYPAQGIAVSYSAQSANERFNKEFSRAVVKALKDLDALEKELGSNVGSTDTVGFPRRSGK